MDDHACRAALNRSRIRLRPWLFALIAGSGAGCQTVAADPVPSADRATTAAPETAAPAAQLGRNASNASPAETETPDDPVPVVLLHGLARHARSMNRLAEALAAAGRPVCAIDYPSTEKTVEDLAAVDVGPAMRACVGAAPRFDVVTHSMGAIVLRQLLVDDPGWRVGRVVMLGPPNHGSQVVDRIGDWRLFGWINGPAGRQLGTGPDSLPNRLPPAPFEVGVIAGSRSMEPWLSWMIPGTDDGKVGVDSARLDGMADYLVLPATHTFVMRNRQAIAQTLAFLARGQFDRPKADAQSQRLTPPPR